MIAEGVLFRAAAMAGRLARLAQGSGTATVVAYPLPRPEGGAAPAGSALSSVPLASTPGVVNEDGTLSLLPAGDGLNLSSGVVGWCRVLAADGAWCFDMDAAEEGSPEAEEAEAIFGTTQLRAGGGLRLVSCTLG